MLKTQSDTQIFHNDNYLLEFRDGNYFIFERDNLLCYAQVSENLFCPSEIRFYLDASKEEEFLRIYTDQNFSYYKTYTIMDSINSKTLGYVKLGKYKSVFIDQWKILDLEKKEIGYIKEHNNLLSMLRYMISMKIPQKFDVVIDDKKVSFFEQTLSPFGIKMHLDFSLDAKDILDKKLAIAYAMICTIQTKHGDVSGD